MSKNAVWTVRHGNAWQVKRVGADKASSTHDTQAAANKVARQIAINNGCEHIIQGKDGKIVNRNSYGNDPCPPKDTK